MKYTFVDFKKQYPNDGACLDAILARRYGAAEACPRCGVVGKLTRIEGRRAYACKEGCHVFPCVGTVFEHSSTPLTLWFHAMYLMTTTRNGVSAKELQRQLGVTYKCAWRIGHQLRDLMSARAAANNPGQLSGHVEVDETYIGGKVQGKGRRYVGNKSTVVGIVQREGDVRGFVVSDVKRKTLLPLVRKNVAEGSRVSTDTYASYGKLKKLGYKHGMVNHDIDEWVKGIYSTNTIEGFWSHLKRGIKSTHASVSRKHLQRYVDEFVFRYNNRQEPAVMFARMLAQISKPTSEQAA